LKSKKFGCVFVLEYATEYIHAKALRRKGISCTVTGSSLASSAFFPLFLSLTYQHTPAQISDLSSYRLTGKSFFKHRRRKGFFAWREAPFPVFHSLVHLQQPAQIKKLSAFPTSRLKFFQT
jgi:hypothetical protein